MLLPEGRDALLCLGEDVSLVAAEGDWAGKEKRSFIAKDS